MTGAKAIGVDFPLQTNRELKCMIQTIYAYFEIRWNQPGRRWNDCSEDMFLDYRPNMERSVDATATSEHHRNTILIPLGISLCQIHSLYLQGLYFLLRLRRRVKGSQWVTHLQHSPHHPQHRTCTQTLPGSKHFKFLQLWDLGSLMGIWIKAWICPFGKKKKNEWSNFRQFCCI